MSCAKAPTPATHTTVMEHAFARSQMKKLKKEAEELTALDGKADVQGCPRVLASRVSAVLVPNFMDADHGSCEVVGARRKQILGPKLQYLAEIMSGAGTNQGRRQVQQINTGDWRKPEVCIKRKEWEVQRDEQSEAAVLGVASFYLTLQVLELT